jgi:uncharacterized membrane protein
MLIHIIFFLWEKQQLLKFWKILVLFHLQQSFIQKQNNPISTTMIHQKNIIYSLNIIDTSGLFDKVKKCKEQLINV